MGLEANLTVIAAIVLCGGIEEYAVVSTQVEGNLILEYGDDGAPYVPMTLCELPCVWACEKCVLDIEWGVNDELPDLPASGT